ncbi:hypothetical protein [Kalamiella sp. sgz302252]|uniref:hypothetical protein n=1 Tax=Pantoea sp. sgz302252 TaxID=3341827 RepID=UPI0036D35308
MLKNRVYRACATSAPPPLAASHQLKFLADRLQDLVPTNDDCYLSACNGLFCIIDRYRPAVAGSRVLLDIAGRCEWAIAHFAPEKFVTMSGETIEGKGLHEATILGVVIQEVISTRQRCLPGRPHI